MGTLRFILALSVAYGHAGDFLGFPLIPGDTAVQCFYAISGFYMALVLNEKYRPGSSTYSLFISNRFLRLFPIYATVLCFTLLLAIALSALSKNELPFVSQWQSLDRSSLASLAFFVVSQVVMWGQELYVFLAVKNGSFVFSPDFHIAAQPVFMLAPIPQAWTLGLEFSFYLLAPFIVRRSAAFIAAVLAASLALRLFLQFGFGLSGDPWSYRFFPSELAVFLVGALGYHVYRLRSIAFDRSVLSVFAVAILCVGGALLVNRWHGLSRVASVSFLILTFAAIPFLFRATNKNALDRALGELSYPIYICHILVIWFVDCVTAFSSGLVRGAVIITVTIIFSGALYWLIDRPVDGWRQRRFVTKRSEGMRLPGTGVDQLKATSRS
jgi:peptidoglycan/LPS O-acetylase OafA/YrhL